MLFLRKINFKPAAAVLFAFTGLIAVLGFLPPAQSSGDLGIQSDVFAGATITTSAKTQTVACGQGAGMIGRKTLVVENASSSAGRVTVTLELRTGATAPNFTSGYLAVNNVATNTATSATTSTTAAAGRYCYVSAVSASTSTVTATLRRE